MVCALRPYSTYKDSGVPWLGRVPEHWSVLPNRALFGEVIDRNHPDEEMLSVAIAEGVVGQRTLLEHSSMKDASNLDRSAYKLARPGDIVYNKMRAWQGAIGASDLRGIVSPAYVVERLRHANHPRYFHYLFRTPQFAKEAERWSYGITSDMWSLRPEHFRMIACLLPLLDEQAAIVRYLDYMDRRIQKYIRAKQRLIALLNEQKQAIIQRAVTRGLDPNVRLKPSGVPWLGDIPEHWGLHQLKRLVQMNPSKLESVEWLQKDRDVVFLPMDHVGTDGSTEPSDRQPASAVWNGFTYFHKGDVIVAKITPCFENGKGAYLGDLPTEIGFGSTEFFVLRPQTLVLPQYLRLVTASPRFRQLGADAMVGAAGQQRVPSDFIKGFPVALPPISEQSAIVKYLDGATASLDKAIDATRHEIDLLREYRTRLIADVVTGKLDVREAAANLPDESEMPPEPCDEEPGDYMPDLGSEEESDDEQAET